MLDKKQIWLFKEARAGSTWFCKALEKRINRLCHHYEAFSCKHFLGPDRSKKISDLEYAANLFEKEAQNLRNLDFIYTTHYFSLLQHIDLLDKETILIRLTRRNRAEHCMSKLAYSMFFRKNATHLFTDPIRRNGLPLESTSLYTEPVLITKQQIKLRMQNIKQTDEYWDSYSKNHKNSVVVYEDLEEGVYIDALGFTMKFSDDTSTVMKSPSYKKDAFINYEQILDWCNEYEEKYQLNKY